MLPLYLLRLWESLASDQGMRECETSLLFVPNGFRGYRWFDYDLFSDAANVSLAFL